VYGATAGPPPKDEVLRNLSCYAGDLCCPFPRISWWCTDVRLVVHDYSGHPGQVHLSRELARRGHHVEHQFCSSYTTGRGATERRSTDPATFEVRALELGTEFARDSPVQRVRQELQYARIATRAILDARPEVTVLSNIPLIALFLVAVALRLRKMPYVFWHQDVYSDAIAVVARRRLGLAGRLVGLIARQAERQVARGAAGVVPISDTFIDQLDAWGVPRSKVTVIPNWGAIDEMPLRPRDNAWAQAHAMTGESIVMYAGTLGLKHDPAVLARLAENAPAGSRLVVVTQGQGRQWLESEAAGTPGLTLLDYQPYEQLPDMLASADVLLVVLESDASRYSVPSKVLNYFCAGRPVLGLLPRDNAVAQMIEAAGAGYVVDPSDTAAVTAAVKALLDDPVARADLGAAARRYAETTFDVQRVGDHFESVIDAAYDRFSSLPSKR
jgi:colanic acid biosynthesis glycosyl transferase WcaI